MTTSIHHNQSQLVYTRRV